MLSVIWTAVLNDRFLNSTSGSICACLRYSCALSRVGTRVCFNKDYYILHAQEQYNFSFYYTKKSKYTYKIQIGVS